MKIRPDLQTKKENANKHSCLKYYKVFVEKKKEGES